MFHKSAKGKVVNFDEMVLKNATTIAVGNANLNARGDLVGPGGRIIESAADRNAQSDMSVSTTTKVSIQSEISSLKNARSQWTASELPSESTPEMDQEPVADVIEDQPIESSTKKPRKMTESE